MRLHNVIIRVKKKVTKKETKLKLKVWLEEQEISMTEFGQQLGVSKATVSRWCNGDRIPPVLMTQKILQETNGAVSAEDFYPNEG